MPTFGADISGFDPDSAAGEYPFVILNLEDQRWTTKAHIAAAAGVFVMTYSWIYHGHGRESVLRAYAAEELIRLAGGRFVHHWLDYEDGVTPTDLDDARTAIRSGYSPMGTYGYLAMILQQGADFWDSIIGPLWIAYYPAGYETVEYQTNFSDTARRFGAVMHQWTSVAGPDGRDNDVVLDDAWYASVVGAATPQPSPEEDPDMQTMLFTTRQSDSKTFCYWRHGGQLLMRGFSNGAPDADIAVVSSDCDPTNLHIENSFGVLYTPSANGRLVQVTQSDFGPIAKVV